MGIINPFSQGNRIKSSETTVDKTGPDIRLLLCGECKTIQVLDDYDGPQEMAEFYDVALNTLVERHKNGVERIPHAPAMLFRVKESSWDNDAVREQIVKELLAKFDPDYETGLGSEAYAIRDTFREDAMTCWQRHNRTHNCADYKTDKMQLVPDTAAERKEAGIAKFDRANPSTKRFLCEYCPVESLVAQRKRERAGLYDK